jgi:hypothetical protein
MVMIGNAKDEIGVATQPFDVLELARRVHGRTAMSGLNSPSGRGRPQRPPELSRQQESLPRQ